MSKTVAQQTPTTSPLSQGGILQRKCETCGQHTVAGEECEGCSKKRQLLQRRATNQAESSEVPPIVHEVLSSPGQPLDKATRDFMEPRFGHDFSQVRVHTDRAAAESARSVNALAYTVGRNVVFGTGQYAPKTKTGEGLLAHELTHVVQQASNVDFMHFNTPLSITNPHKNVEREAEAASRAIIQGDSFTSAISRASLQVARENGTSAQQTEEQPAQAAELERPLTPTTCTSAIAIDAPNNQTLKRRLETYQVLQPRGQSTEFANILYRHVTADTAIGNEYLQFLHDNAYPMETFCLTYRGNGWNATFREILRLYGVGTPSTRAMRLVRAGVENYARQHLYIYEPLPSGFQGPPLPLTPQTLRRKTRGTVLAVYPPESILLMKATDDYLASLTLTATSVTAITPSPVASGATTAEDIFAWGTATAEGTVRDPNSFDSLIVQWVNQYNNLFAPLDTDGNPNPLDPDLVKAMIFVESRFSDTAASSRSSARGLTQVLSRERQLAGEITAGISGITDTNFSSDAGLQIATGIRILFEKYRRSRNWRTAIRDYNGSPSKEAYASHVMRVYESHRRR
ncbi:hypothetical protein NIES4101_36330 [Calothrix sp. NIES-4101]|nr:hypothetical protein NIES4101_36330 [Calothrix sp. NIES-4101]